VLPDPLVLHILPFMEDSHHLDLFASIPEEEHMRRHREAPDPRLDLGTLAPDLPRGFSEQLALGPDPDHHAAMARPAASATWTAIVARSRRAASENRTDLKPRRIEGP
jgi:hypothetical protein